MSCEVEKTDIDPSEIISKVCNDIGQEFKDDEDVKLEVKSFSSRMVNDILFTRIYNDLFLLLSYRL